MLKKINLTLLLIACAMFCTSIFAITKDGIVEYVNSQSVCGDTALFNTYKTTFTRLLKQKQLSETELNSIYSYLNNSVSILNSKGVCKVSDLDKLTVEEKNSVIGNLSTGASIITNAPNIDWQSSNTEPTNEVKITNEKLDKTSQNTQGTKIAINQQDSTIDIYDNGILVDKLSISGPKMTYTGRDARTIITIVIVVTIFTLLMICYLFLYKIHNKKTRTIKNILISFMICSVVVIFAIFILGDEIEQIVANVRLFSVNVADDEIKVELNEDKTIKTYPSYGLNYATISISQINVYQKVYFGDTQTILALGVGHTTWSDMPTEKGLVVYSGHNKILGNLKDISIKDEIIIDTTYAKCTYIVNSTKILKDTQLSELKSTNDKETLILYTCYPFDTYVYTADRFAVFANLKEIQWK